MRPKIGWMLVYWGAPYGYMDKYAKRAMQSKCIEPVLVGDVAAFSPAWWPAKRLSITVEQFEARLSEIVGRKVHKTCFADNPGKSIAELRWMIPDCYPEIFAGYEWIGYTELDVVWGDFDRLLTDELLGNYDVMSTNSYLAVNGPGTFFRNTPEVRGLWRKKIDWVISPDTHYLDESGMDAIVRQSGLRWKSLGVERSDTSKPYCRCKLRDNKLFAMDERENVGPEIWAFHFPNPKRWPLA